MTDQTNFNDPRWNPEQHSLRDYERDEIADLDHKDGCPEADQNAE